MSKRFRRWTILFALCATDGAGVHLHLAICEGAGLDFFGMRRSSRCSQAIFWQQMLIERLLWNTGLSLRAMSIIEIPLMVAFNGVAWFVVIGSIRWLLGTAFPLITRGRC